MSSSGSGPLPVNVLYNHRARRELSCWQALSWIVSGCNKWLTWTNEGMKHEDLQWKKIFPCTISNNPLSVLFELPVLCGTLPVISVREKQLWRSFLEDSYQGRNTSMDFLNFRVISYVNTVDKGWGHLEGRVDPSCHTNCHSSDG